MKTTTAQPKETVARIFVDDLRPCVPNRNWRFTAACHLFTEPGNEEALHAFAQQIGLRRAWYQTQSAMPHYDLTVAVRRIAVVFGATAMSREATVAMMASWRSWHAGVTGPGKG